MYASPNTAQSPSPYPLEFCVWMQNNFDTVIEMNEEMKDHDHVWVPTYNVSATQLKHICRCGAIRPETVIR